MSARRAAAVGAGPWRPRIIAGFARKSSRALASSRARRAGDQPPGTLPGPELELAGDVRFQASSTGASLGSVAVRRAVEDKRPALLVCGHIHGSAGQTAAIGSTPVVNAGPAGRVWDLRTGDT